MFFKKIEKYLTPYIIFLLVYFGGIFLLDIFLTFWKLPLIGAAIVTVLHLGLVVALAGGAFGEIKKRENLPFSFKHDWGFSTVLEAVDDGVIIYDDHFRIHAMNRRAEEIAGVKKEEILGQELSPDLLKNPHFKILVQLMYPTLSGALKRSGADREITELKIAYPRELYLVVHSLKMHDDTGAVLGNLKLIKDKTEEMHAARNQSEFITLAAHQLSSPISELRWGIENLKDNSDFPPSLKNELEQFNTPLKKLLKISEDLLGIARRDAGMGDYQFENVDFVGFLEDLLRSYELMASRKKVRITFESEAELPRIPLDVGKMRMALGNIIDNAIRYSKEGSEIDVRATRILGKNFIELIIRDHGIGISVEDLGKIGQRFFRGTNAMKFETEGSGLGIFVARSIIVRHGGELKIASKEGEGTQVQITLPTDRALIPK